MAEITYFSDSAVQVSSDWVKLGGKIYSVNDIKSVKVRSAQPAIVRDLPYLLMIAGSITTFLLLNIQQIFPSDWEDLMPAFLIAGLGIALVGLGVLIVQSFLRTDYLYAVSLSGSFGKVSPFASDDPHYVNTVASAINNAIGSRLEMPMASTVTADL